MKIKMALSALLIGALTLSACGSGGSSSDGDGPIKLGAWLPLSGPVAGLGESAEAGLEAFFGQLNADGGVNGRDVEWKAVDNQYDPQQTLQAARQLVGGDGVVAIVGALGVSQTEAAFPYVLEQNKVPILGPYAGATSWYTPAREGLFGVQGLYEEGAAVAAEWAVEEGAQNVLVVHNDPESFKIVADLASESATASGATASTMPVRFGTTDYAPIVNDVKSRKPDAVVLALAPAEAVAYLQEAALQQIGVPAYGYPPTADLSVISALGEDAEGFRAVSWVRPPTDDSPEIEEYRQALEKYAPGQEPDFPSLFMYATAKVFAEIASTIDGEITAESLAKAYESTENLETGILPPISFGANNHLGTNQFIRVEVTNGEFVSVGDFLSRKN